MRRWISTRISLPEPTPHACRGDWRVVVVLAVALLLALLSGGAHPGEAQPSPQVQPQDSLVLSDTTPTGVVTLTNTEAQPEGFWLAPACVMRFDTATAEQTSPFAAVWHNQTTCAAPWLAGYPQHVQLAPGERRTFTVRMTPPPTVPDGQYTVRLIWGAELPQGPDALHQGANGHWEIKIKYTKGPTPPRPARTRWRATPPTEVRGRQVQVQVQVQATPAVLVLADSSQPAAVTLRNPAGTPTEVWLAVECPWFRVNYRKYPYSHQYESAWHGRMPSAAFWLSGYPQHLVLAPHEQRTIPIEAFNYSIWLPAGDYYARLIYVQSPLLSVSSAGDTTFSTLEGGVDVVYHHGAPPQLTLHDLHGTPPAGSGPSQACVTVQQPGLGLVAVLHAELAASGGRSRRPVWRQDTTVAIWVVPHHNPMDIKTDDWWSFWDHGKTALVPAPVCLALPPLAAGHYRLLVQAYELDDTAKHNPVQDTLSLEMP